jgi:hypothetical protein
LSLEQGGQQNKEGYCGHAKGLHFTPLCGVVHIERPARQRRYANLWIASLNTTILMPKTIPKHF